MNAPRCLLLFLVFFAVAASAAEPLSLTWTIDGVERQALVFPPAPAAAAAKAPVVFGFHGHGGTMQNARMMAAAARAARQPRSEVGCSATLRPCGPRCT